MSARQIKPGNNCQVCDEPRGKRTEGWTSILAADNATVIGWTCPSCPKWRSPIRRIEVRGRFRFRAVVDATPPGARKRKQVNRVFDTLAEAEEFVENFDRAKPVEGEANQEPTVAELCEDWLASCVDVRQVTVEGYRHMLKPALRFLGDRRVSTITRADIRRLITWMTTEGGRQGQALGPRSVKGTLGRLQSAYDFGIEEKYPITANPVQGVKRPRQSKRTGTDLEHWETIGEHEEAHCPGLLQFRAVSDADPLAPIWRLTLCGMTRADLMGLRWSDINLDSGVATVRQGRVVVDAGDKVDDPKSQHRNREVEFEALYPGTIKMLKAMKAAARLRSAVWSENGLVVVDEEYRPLRPEVYSDRFKRLCAEAGVPVINLHSVRHTLAFLGHRRDIAPADMAALLGHSVEVHMATYLPQGKASVATRALAPAMAAA